MKHKAVCKLVSLALSLTLLLGLSLTVYAGSTDIEIPDATYYDSGALKSLTTSFMWDTGSANGRLVLMTKRLRSANEDGAGPWGDFTDFGEYSGSFSSFDEVLAFDKENGTFGIVSSSEEGTLRMMETSTFVFNFKESDIPLEKDQLYYIYLWTSYMGWVYPDNLVLAIQVKDGVVKYTPATGQNEYDISAFQDVVSQIKYSVKVVSAANMVHVTGTGALEQKDLGVPMTPVVFTAASGYYFPEDYAVDSVNGIQVSRDSATQITVYGMPTGDVTLTLKAPTEAPAHKIQCQDNGKAEGGSFSVDQASAKEGETVTVTAKPDSGYEVAGITVTKTGDSKTQIQVQNGKFQMPGFDVTVSVTFALQEQEEPTDPTEPSEPETEPSEPETEPSEPETQPSQPETSTEPSAAPTEPVKTEEAPKSNGWILWVVIGVVAVGGAAAVILIQKKK